jgi:hypothetical protein
VILSAQINVASENETVGWSKSTAKNINLPQELVSFDPKFIASTK